MKESETSRLVLKIMSLSASKLVFLRMSLSLSSLVFFASLHNTVLNDCTFSASRIDITSYVRQSKSVASVMTITLLALNL